MCTLTFTERCLWRSWRWSLKFYLQRRQRRGGVLPRGLNHPLDDLRVFLSFWSHHPRPVFYCSSHHHRQWAHQNLSHDRQCDPTTKKTLSLSAFIHWSKHFLPFPNFHTVFWSQKAENLAFFLMKNTFRGTWTDKKLQDTIFKRNLRGIEQKRGLYW